MNPVKLITTVVVAWMLPDSAGMLDLCSAAQDDNSQPSISWPADAIPKPLYADPHDGLAVFRSSDAIKWEQKSRILKEHGTGPRDATLARHPSVAVLDNRFIFYHVEPDRPYPTPPAQKRTIKQELSFLQIAELKIQNGELVCDRDQPVEVNGGPSLAAPGS